MIINICVLVRFFFLVALSAAFAVGQDNRVVMSFTVLDERGVFYRELAASDFQVRRGKSVLPIQSFISKTDSSLEILLLIDASISQERVITDGKKVAEYFIDSVLRKEKDRVAVASFTGIVRLEKDMTGDFSNAKSQLRKIEVEIPTGYIGGTVVSPAPPISSSSQAGVGSTSIWESIIKSIEAMAAIKSTNTRKAIILISDGVNTYGEAKLKGAVNASLRNRIPIFAVGIGDDFYGGVDKETLKKLTEQTNGISIVPKKNLEDLPDLIKKIEQSLLFNYELTFSHDTATDSESLQETKIEFVNPELKKRKLRIVQPRGYFLSN